MALESLCVFAGSNPGARPEYAQLARRLGDELAGQGVTLVYGGGSVGLMGAIADAVMAGGGKVVGVIPQFLVDREVAKTDVSELIVVETMHERKLTMYEYADAFAALPGGLGTLEELFEMLTWAQLGHHAKPCALLNAENYYDGLLSFLDKAVEQRFVRPAHRELLAVATSPADLLQALQYSRKPHEHKWIDRDTRGSATD